MTPVIESLDDPERSRRRGCGESEAALHGFVARAGLARANRLDRASVAAFDFRPGSCVLEFASSDDLADVIGDKLARTRRTAVRHAAACLDYAVPDDFTQVADRLQQRAADAA